MTKSRKARRSRKTQDGGRLPSDRPYRSIAGQMTADNERAVVEAADAELRGEIKLALRLHRSVPMYLRSTHGDRLQLMAELGTDAPGWLVSRWLTVIARRRQWTGGDQGAINRTLQFVVPLVHPDGIQFERIGCEWTEQVLPFINERDWVVRQVDLYELGALRELLGRLSPELVERADQIEAWCRAPMRACRIEGVDSSGAITITDLSTGEVVGLLDRGLLEQFEAGQHVLGRIVPIAEGPGAMFDWRPLPVTREAAHAVAEDPRLWLATLRALAVAGRLEPAYSHQPETSLTSDLPKHAWMTLVGIPFEEADDHDPDDVVVRALEEVLSLASRGADEVAARRHLIGDLILDPALTDHVRWRFVRPDQLSAWQVLAEVLPEPARSRCAQAAMWCDATPELPDAIA